MLSIDTNILFHAFNEDSPRHATAYGWLRSIQQQEDVAISEFILAELYGSLRNPAVLKHPLDADEAVDVIQTYRRHPRWRLIGFPLESRP
jgi:predicted nucleic acid-binding protein